MILAKEFRRNPCLLQLTFFGLNHLDRVLIFSEIHEIVFNGQGGYDWPTVYNMPVWLRKFTFAKMKEHYSKKSEGSEEGFDPNSITKPVSLAKPPTFSTKLSPPKK